MERFFPDFSDKLSMQFGVKLYGFDSGQSQTMKGTCCNLLEDLYDIYTLRILTPQKWLF